MTALTDYLKIQRQSDVELNRILEKTARDARRELRRLGDTADRVRVARLRSTIAAIKSSQHDLWSSGVRDAMVRGRQAAATAAEASARTLDGAVWGRTTPARVRTLQTAAQARIRTVATNALPRELSSRIYKNDALMSGKLDALIRSHIIRGSSVQTMTKSVYQFISPTAPGGASAAALRLARTEMGNAFHDAQIIAAQSRPWVKGMRWVLSGSHSHPDACNDYAGRTFKLSNVPDKPHPLCLCTLDEIFVADPMSVA
jgi:hypothetical protein